MFSLTYIQPVIHGLNTQLLMAHYDFRQKLRESSPVRLKSTFLNLLHVIYISLHIMFFNVNVNRLYTTLFQFLR